MIGNPPYVNIEKISEDIKKNIAQCKTAYEVFELYVLFYERAIDLLKKNGILSFITSNKFLSQGYGILLRQLFLKNNIQQIVNFNFDIFESATVRTCIVQMSKSVCQKEQMIKVIDVAEKKDAYKFFNNEYTYIKQSVFQTTEENNFRINLTIEKTNILEHIKSNCLCVYDICSVNYGLRPSSEILNLKKEAFIHNTNHTGNYKEYFEGKDMGYWIVKQTSFLDYRPDVMYNAMFPELFSSNKLVGLRTLSDITKLRFIYDEEGLYCNDSVVILTLWHLLEDIENMTISRNITNEKINLSKQYTYQYLQGILNSKIIKFYFNELMYDGTHFYPNHMKSLPIPTATPKQQQPIITLVDKILSTKKSDPFANTNTLEQQIDQLVYKLYGLTEEEIKVIEK